MESYALRAGGFLLPGGMSGAGYLEVRGGRFGFFSAENPGLPVVDLGGSLVSPGLVDTHIHGLLGHDALDADPDGVRVMCQGLVRHGVTSWLPTVLTAGIDEIGRACAAIARAAEDVGQDPAGGARIQGIFLEGPFFTEKHKGAQNPRYFMDPSLAVFDGWQEEARGLIRKIAIAPERTGAAEFTAVLSGRGVCVSLAHGDASYAEAMACVNAGATEFIHTYNAMSGLHHREPGMVGAAMDSPDTYAELICDGNHVAPPAVRALVQAKGSGHVALVTDCLRCGAMPPGEYYLGEFPVVVRDGAAHLKDGGNLAGSILMLDEAVRNVVSWGAATPQEALRMATVVPARANGIQGACGEILPGRPADFVVLDQNLTVSRTFMGGDCVYQRGQGGVPF